MDKKIHKLINKWLDNHVISQSVYDEILKFEKDANPSQK